MIQVNLLPGTASKSQGREFNIGAMLSTATAGIRDKFLMAAVVSVGTVVASIALLFMAQSNLERSLTERERQAMQDSARYKVVLAARDRAESTRDSLYQQVAIIKSIDDSRYLWSHLMYEISNALPQYTWLKEVSQTSLPKSVAAADKTKRAAADTGTSAKAKAERVRAQKARADSLLAEAKEIKFRLVGHTVDIQALTRFMKSLEASPFIQNVQLTRSDLVQNEGKEVTEFSLEAETQAPPAFAIKTVPLIVSAVR